MAESVADVRRTLEAVGASTDDMLDAVIAEYLTVAREILARPHSEEEQEIYGFAPNERVEDEAHTALG
jgi:hypothetical protein